MDPSDRDYAKDTEKGYRSLLQMNDSLLDRIFDQFPSIVEIQFAHYSRAVILHGLDADMQQIGHFSVRIPFCDQLKDFAFPLSENMVRI